MLENDICVDLLDAPSGKLDCVNSPLSWFFSRARCPPILAPSCVAAVKVANSPLSWFFARARCPPVLAPSGVAAIEVYG